MTFSRTPAHRRQVPSCPDCHERTAVRRVVDPEHRVTHRCGKCRVGFVRVGV